MFDRSTPPKPKSKIDFNLPEIEKFNAGNNIIYYSKKVKLPIVQLNIIIEVGSCLDPVDKKGLALLTSLLIDEGAGKYDSFELNDEFEKLGTVLSINVNHDTFSFSMLSLSENFEKSFALLTEILNSPSLKAEDFEREKKKLKSKIIQLKKEPSYIANTAFDKIIFDGTYYAYPEIGYLETLENITIDDVKEYYQKYIQNNRLNLTVVGNVSKDNIVSLVNKNFSGRQELNNEQFIEPTLAQKTKIYIVDKKEAPQTELRIGHIGSKRNEETYYSIKLMNTILGGDFSSRINLNLREKKGFTYGAGSVYNYHKNAGFFEVFTAVNTENTGESIYEIIKEINGIKDKIEEDEINFAKSYHTKKFPSLFETYTQLAKNITPLIIHKLDTNYYQNYIEKINSVKDEEILNAAKQYLHPNNLVIVAVGDRNKIYDQIKGFGAEILIIDETGNVLETN
ncbi:M16 family metallopeptidase [Melioribacter sp. OK-6-Me]|uniref:M16 family metallopeptidase n=1 Tax=unclassified Melioribacter TaxID=2627329 RepID=UPI003ED853F2